MEEKKTSSRESAKMLEEPEKSSGAGREQISTTVLPGERSGTEVAGQGASVEPSSTGVKKPGLILMIREPYSTWKRRTNRPAGNRDKDVDTCVLCSCCILFLAVIGVLVWLCITYTSPRKSTVYSVNSIVIPYVEPTPSRTDIATMNLTEGQEEMKKLRADLEADDQNFDALLRREDRDLKGMIEKLNGANKVMLETALRNDYCELDQLKDNSVFSKSSAKALQSDDLVEITKNPTFGNCVDNITITDAEKKTKTFVFHGMTCDIICPSYNQDESLNFYNLIDISNAYKNLSKKISCQKGNVTNLPYWTAVGQHKKLIGTNMPLCYKRHCLKRELDPNSNFKCLTTNGPNNQQIVSKGESCIFVGCTEGKQRKIGNKGDLFVCGENGKFTPQGEADFPLCIINQTGQVVETSGVSKTSPVTTETIVTTVSTTTNSVTPSTTPQPSTSSSDVKKAQAEAEAANLRFDSDLQTDKGTALEVHDVAKNKTFLVKEIKPKTEISNPKKKDEDQKEKEDIENVLDDKFRKWKEKYETEGKASKVNAVEAVEQFERKLKTEKHHTKPKTYSVQDKVKNRNQTVAAKTHDKTRNKLLEYLLRNDTNSEAKRKDINATNYGVQSLKNAIEDATVTYTFQHVQSLKNATENKTKTTTLTTADQKEQKNQTETVNLQVDVNVQVDVNEKRKLLKDHKIEINQAANNNVSSVNQTEYDAIDTKDQNEAVEGKAKNSRNATVETGSGDDKRNASDGDDLKSEKIMDSLKQTDQTKQKSSKTTKTAMTTTTVSPKPTTLQTTIITTSVSLKPTTTTPTATTNQTTTAAATLATTAAATLATTTAVTTAATKVVNREKQNDDIPIQGPELEVMRSGMQSR